MCYLIASKGLRAAASARVMRRAIRRNVAVVTSMQYDTFDTHYCVIDRSSGARSELVPNEVLR
jgi:hypothetical protein